MQSIMRVRSTAYRVGCAVAQQTLEVKKQLSTKATLFCAAKKMAEAKRYTSLSGGLRKVSNFLEAEYTLSPQKYSEK